MNDQKRVCVVDNDSTFSSEVAKTIRAAGYACHVCESAEEFLADLAAGNTVCAVFNLNVKDITGVDLQKILSARPDGVPIIFTALSATVTDSVQLMKGGAIDVLIFPFEAQRLVEAICEATKKHQSTEELARVMSQYNLLTDREKEVFRLVSLGLLNKQIASVLKVTEQTIKVHRGRVMRKLKAQSVVELVRLSEKVLPPADLQLVPQALHAEHLR